MDATTDPATEHFRAGWEACGFRRATAGGVEDMTPTLHPSRHRVDTFPVTSPSCRGPCGRASGPAAWRTPRVIGSDHLPVRLALPGLLNAAGLAAMPTPYSHMEGRLLPYNAEAAPVQRCLWSAVTAAQDEPSLAPWLGPAEQHAYGSMPAAAVDKVFEQLHAAHDALARTVGRQQPLPTGTDPAGGDPPGAENGYRWRSSATTPWQRARERHTRRMRPGTACTLRQRSDSRRSCVVHCLDSARPHRASCRRSWRGKQPPSRRTSATCAHSWPINDFWRCHAQDMRRRRRPHPRLRRLVVVLKADLAQEGVVFALPQRLGDHAGAGRHADYGLGSRQALGVAGGDMCIRRAEHADHPLWVLLSSLRHCQGGCQAGVRYGPRMDVRDIRGPDGVTLPCGL